MQTQAKASMTVDDVVQQGFAKRDRNDELAEEIATLAAQIQAADYRLLLLIREFDANGGWAQQGAKTCAQWLSWRIGLAPNAARERLRVIGRHY